MRSNQTEPDEIYSDALTITPEQVCFIIIKAREFDVKDSDSELESGSNASDDQMISVLEDRRDDPVQQELASFIETMTEDEQIDLVALAWLGRDDDNTIEDWPSIRRKPPATIAGERAGPRVISWGRRSWATTSKRGCRCLANPASQLRSAGFDQWANRGGSVLRTGVVRKRASDRSLPAQHDASLSRSRQNRNGRVRVLCAQASARPEVLDGRRP